jgi:uncharacterized protein YndB with AHSA1/START domain
VGEYRFSIHVEAPPDDVFALWIDLDRAKEWIGGLTKVSDVTGPVDQPGTRYTSWFGSMRSPTEVLEVTRPNHFRTRFGSWLLAGESAATFEPEDTGTRLTQTFRTQGFIPAIMGRIFATGSWSGSFRGELEHFGRIAEADARRPLSAGLADEAT